MWEIGGYIVRSELGRGGMATVYLAEEALSRRLVALKILHAELARSEDARRRFISEMQILTTLEHPNLVRCYHCNDVNGQLMMALEYVRGRTLRAVLEERTRVPALEASRIAIGIVAALNAAHTNEPPVIHRDLKPENVLIGDDGVIKVADFGIAKMLGTATTTTSAHGTLQYMSPERLEGLPTTASTDLYSLGVVLYEMVVGQRPFLARAPLDLIRAHHSQEPPPIPDVIARELPPRLVQLIFQLLRKEPARRPTSASTVHAHLVDIVERATPQVSRPSPQASFPFQEEAPQQHVSMPMSWQPTSGGLDTVQLVEQFAQEYERRSRGIRAVWWGGLSLALVVLVVVVVVGWARQSNVPDEGSPLPAKASDTARSVTVDDDTQIPVAARSAGADSQQRTRARSSDSKPLPPPPGSSRELVSEFLKARDPGGPVPVHPELQRTDYAVKVMVRRDLLEAQRGARIVADTLVNGARPKVQIMRRPRRGRSEHWVLVGRHLTRSEAVAQKALLRPILNQGAIQVELAAKCAFLGPIVDGVRECVPP